MYGFSTHTHTTYVIFLSSASSAIERARVGCLQLATASDWTRAALDGCTLQRDLMAAVLHLPASETSSKLSPLNTRDVTTTVLDNMIKGHIIRAKNHVPTCTCINILSIYPNVSAIVAQNGWAALFVCLIHILVLVYSVQHKEIHGSVIVGNTMKYNYH